MNLVVCEDQNSFLQAATKWCEAHFLGRSRSSLFVPAGQTPTVIYTDWEKRKPSFLENVELLQIDDILTGEKSGLFRRFLQTSLPSFQSQMRWLEEGNRGADFAILGLGLNGHVAFHEPGIDRSLFSGCVKLNPQTCQTLELEAGTWGVTYGVQAFLQTRAILMIVRGAGKQKVLKELLSGQASFPAAHLLAHSNLTILADRKAHG